MGVWAGLRAPYQLHSQQATLNANRMEFSDPLPALDGDNRNVYV